MRTESGPVIRLEDYKPTDFIIETVDMTFRLDEQATKVTTRLGMRRREGWLPMCRSFLTADELELTDLHLDDDALENGAYDVTPDRLAVYNLPESSAFELEIKTTINPTANTKLMGLFRTGGNYCTQCEAEGFRRITYFLDRPTFWRFTRCALKPTSNTTQSCFPTATVLKAVIWMTIGILLSGTTLTPNRPTCLLWWPDRWARLTRISPQSRGV